MNTKNQNTSISGSFTAPKVAGSESMKEINYSEIPGLRSPEVDVLNQFQSNLKALTDLHFKLSYVLSEVKSVLRK